VEPIERLIGFLTSIGDLNMKMFRPGLVGILPVFGLLLGIQLNAGATGMPREPRKEFSSLAGALFCNSAGHSLLEGVED